VAQRERQRQPRLVLRALLYREGREASALALLQVLHRAADTSADISADISADTSADTSAGEGRTRAGTGEKENEGKTSAGTGEKENEGKGKEEGQEKEQGGEKEGKRKGIREERLVQWRE